MRLLFAGTEPGEMRDVVMSAGGVNYLNSFWSLGCGKKEPKPCGDFYLLDSGGYSARKRGVKINVKEYADYINRYGIKWAFNLDTSDLQESQENQKYLEEHTNCYIMPVYHVSEWRKDETRDYVDYYTDCYPFIAIGGIAGAIVSRKNAERYLNYIFARAIKKGTLCHGLGITRSWALNKYPFFCCDSTSWMSATRYGTSKVFSEEMTKVRNKNRHYTERLRTEVQHYLDMQDEATRIWKSRGVEYGDLNFDEMMAKRKLMTYKEWKEGKK